MQNVESFGKKLLIAGGRVENEYHMTELNQLQRQYRALKQRKKRELHSNISTEIIANFMNDKTRMWKTLSKINQSISYTNMPNGGRFVEFFASLEQSAEEICKNKQYEKDALEFLKRYDKSKIIKTDSLLENFNRNFDELEVESAINSLKTTNHLE